MLRAAFFTSFEFLTLCVRRCPQPSSFPHSNNSFKQDHREWQHLNQHAAAGLDPSKPALRGHLADFPSGFLQEEGMTNKANDPVTFSQVQAMWI